MLFVGGSADGKELTLPKVHSFTIPFMTKSGYSDERGSIEMTFDPEVLGRETYTKRSFINNEGDRSFTVMVLSTLSGMEAMHLLSKGNYKNNPLKWEEKA